MNGSAKQSFYEIQLNNGSLIAAFLVAVALGVAVFILGVMVGRGQIAPDPGAGGYVEDLGSAERDLDTDLEPEFFEKVQESDDATDPVAAAPDAGDTTAADRPETQPQPTVQESAPTPTALPAETAGLPSADPGLASGFVIQVKSTPDREDADSLQERLAEAGYPAYVVEGDVRGRTTYRVRVGRYRSESDASAVERVLRGRNDISETWVTRG